MSAQLQSVQPGYVADVAWPDHFHREQMPGWLHAVCAALGVAAPSLERPFHWCDLGCGGGLSALVAAACFPHARFTAVDVDPAQIERAAATAHEAGLDNIRFVAADLRDFAMQADSADTFDYIVSHGVWAWVGEDVRQAIVDVARHRLAPGGVLQLGYMSHPGASQLQGVHKLMQEAARRVEGDSAARAQIALGLLQQIADGGAGYFAEHPGAQRQLDAMSREAPAHLAHEFLGGEWTPQHCADVMRAFASADCGWIGSATPIENIDALSLPAGLQPMLRALPPGPLAETVRDLGRNQSLRRDLFVREPRRLDTDAHLAALDAIEWTALPGAPAFATGDLRFDTRIGAVEGPRDWFDPALRALADGSKPFATLRRLPPYDQAPGLLNQVLQALLWAGHVHPANHGGRVNHDALRALPQFALLRPVPDAGTAIPAAVAP